MKRDIAFETSDKKLTRVEKKLDALGDKVGVLDNKVNALGDRVNVLERTVETLGKTAATLEKTVETLAGAVARGFEEMRAMFERQAEDIAILRSDMESGFTDVKREFGRVWERLGSLDYTLEMHDLKVRVSKLEKKVGFE